MARTLSNPLALDLTLFSLYRLNGQELPNLPGLMAVTPPRKTARGREHEPLIVSLLLSGNTPFSTADYMKLTSEAAAAFYNTSGALTTALRTAAEAVNRSLLDRNLSTTGRGQYVIGALTLAALRETQLTILQCGSTHVLALNAGQTRHFHDPALSGKGLGLNAALSHYFSQLTLQANDRLLFCPKLPPLWENALGSDRGLQPIETTRKRMMSIVDGDLAAALLQVSAGTGAVTIARPTISETRPAEEPAAQTDTLPPAPPPPTTAPVEAAPTVPAPQAAPEPPQPAETQPETPFRAHVVGRLPEDQPSAYAIPPQPTDEDEALVEQLADMVMQREFPPSIPRLPSSEPEPAPEPKAVTVTAAPARKPSEPRVPSETTRQAARLAVNAIQGWRRASERLGAWFRKFLPRLLPGGESETPAPVSNTVMVFIAIAVPLIVGVIAFVVYARLGRTAQFDALIAQAEALRSQALGETNPVRQREDWDNVLKTVDRAESIGSATPKTNSLQQEAQSHLDTLLGVTRLSFTPAFNAKLDADVSRMAANETDLYMLDAKQGKILRAAVNGGRSDLDTNFDCSPGRHGNVTTSPMVDLVILPKLNTLNSSVAGVDAAGNLLYCSPGQVAQVMPLTAPPTNWGRVTAMTLDSNKLYVLDAPSRAVWVYTGKDSTFPDPPYFYFGSQIPNIQDAIDITANGDELYLLHADGRLTHCTFSRVETVPTRCDSPVPLTNPFPAYGNVNAFTQAHFTQMALTALPDPSVLLLDADGRQVFRINLHTYELQNIFGTAGGAINLSSDPFSAMTVSPNHTLYLAIGNQVYTSTDAP